MPFCWAGARGRERGGKETSRPVQLSGAFPGVESWEVSGACQTAGVGEDRRGRSAFPDALKSDFLPSF